MESQDDVFALPSMAWRNVLRLGAIQGYSKALEARSGD